MLEKPRPMSRLIRVLFQRFASQALTAGADFTPSGHESGIPSDRTRLSLRVIFLWPAVANLTFRVGHPSTQYMTATMSELGVASTKIPLSLSTSRADLGCLPPNIGP